MNYLLLLTANFSRIYGLKLELLLYFSLRWNQIKAELIIEGELHSIFRTFLFQLHLEISASSRTQQSAALLQKHDYQDK